MSRRAKKAMRGRRESWSQKTRCLKQFGSHEWLRKRPRLEKLVASMHLPPVRVRGSEAEEAVEVEAG